jgi:hypothetical protein
MNKIEYWLLDLVVPFRYDLKTLIHREVGEITNKGDHKLNFDELAEMLFRLCQQGDITTSIKEREIKFSLTGIKAGLSGEANIYYGLTAQGGARWEQYSNPNWDRYVDAGFGTDPYEGELVAATRKLVEEHLSYHKVCNYSMRTGSEVWDILSPWQATYWKTLPRGHRIRFEYEPDERTFWASSEFHLLEQLQRQREEYWELTKWYTNYLGDNPYPRA